MEWCFGGVAHIWDWVALAGVKCVLAAREATDGHHQLMRETPASVLDPKVTEEVHAFAADSVAARTQRYSLTEIRRREFNRNAAKTRVLCS